MKKSLTQIAVAVVIVLGIIAMTVFPMGCSKRPMDDDNGNWKRFDELAATAYFFDAPIVKMAMREDASSEEWTVFDDYNLIVSWEMLFNNLEVELRGASFGSTFRPLAYNKVEMRVAAVNANGEALKFIARLEADDDYSLNIDGTVYTSSLGMPLLDTYWCAVRQNGTIPQLPDEFTDC